MASADCEEMEDEDAEVERRWLWASIRKVKEDDLEAKL